MINGQWHPPGSAAQSDAVLRLQGERFIIESHQGLMASGTMDELEVSDRLGNIKRRLGLRDGAAFVTDDNDAVDRMLKNTGLIKRVIHQVESHLAWVICALVITLATGFSFFKWGIPWVSTQVAHALPHQANELISSHTMEFLDTHFFEESQLDEERQEEIRQRFHTLTPPDSEASYTLHFRQWNHGERAIANALALPAGDIILTDAFVNLSQNQKEIDAVLLHEIGHVAHRHSLQMVVQGAIMTVVITSITGDASALADMGAGLGSALVASSFSRDHETEADRYAFEQMLNIGIDPQAFADILQRIGAHNIRKEESPTEEATVEEATVEEATVEEATNEDNNEDTAKTISDYFSSHPATEDRVKQAEKYRRCFQQGLTICEVE